MAKEALERGSDENLEASTEKRDWNKIDEGALQEAAKHVNF
jgi:hypothetical protein